MAKYLDQTGLTYFWGKIKGWVNNSQHPVGSIYISTSSTFNPQTAWGGTWKKTADGRCLIGASTAYPLGSTGGEATHTLTVNEMPSHNHKAYSVVLPSENGDGNVQSASNNSYWKGGGLDNTTATGGGAAHNNMQPYLAVYIWERTA